MNFRGLLLAFTMGLFTLFCHGQDTARYYIGVYAGIGVSDTRINGLDFLNTNYPVYERYYSSYSLEGHFANYSGSVRIERLNRTGQLGISTGIRYSKSVSWIESDSSFKNWMYVKTVESENITTYYRVNSITQYVHSLAVPIEIRFTPFTRRFIKGYIRASFSGGFNVYTGYNIDFFNPEMKSNERQVEATIKRPNLFTTSSSLGVGMSLGSPDNYLINIDIGIPYLVTASSSIVDPRFGSSFNVSFLYPL